MVEAMSYAVAFVILVVGALAAYGLVLLLERRDRHSSLHKSPFSFAKWAATPGGDGLPMNEKLPAPCEHCKGTGLSHGSECTECRGKGYRLIIDGRPVPARQPAKRTRWQRRPPNRR